MALTEGLDFFVPEIWAGRLLRNLNNTHVYARCVNRDYEGEIRNFGDTVHINNIGRITIDDYTANTDMDPAETLSSDQRSLVIDQAKYFNFQIDAIDQAQTKPKVMDEAMAEAAYGLSDEADTYLAGILAAATTNTIGSTVSPEAPDSDTAYEYLVDLGTLLSESNVPKPSRFVVVPPWFYGLLLKDDRFVKYDKVGEAITNGFVGSAAGFKVYESNNVPNTDGAAYKIIAGTKMAATYAEQINKVEAYKPELRFASAVKGLHLYGAKLVRPEAVAVLTADRPSGVS